MEVHLLDHIMRSRMTEHRFDEAQRVFEACVRRLETLCPADAELYATLLSKRAALCNRRNGYVESQGQIEEAHQLREQAIELYQQCLHLLEAAEQEVKRGTLRQSTLKKKKASFLNNLPSHLKTVGRYE